MCRVWFTVYADGSGSSTATMSIRTAPDAFNHTAHNFTSAPFPLPMSSSTTINLRVLTDRSVVEAYAGRPSSRAEGACVDPACGESGPRSFDAVGEVAVEALAFPTLEATGVELFVASEAGAVQVKARVWSMGCGWVGGN